mgnify:CR=1 FL=1|tara:strand:- start:2468 stop:2995 length:528 start_codon:yes stop_codon:yes gene_type:complete
MPKVKDDDIEGLTDAEKYERYIADLDLLTSTQKYWLKRIHFYEKTRQSTGLKSILCDFSGKSLQFQSKHLDLPYEEFATAQGKDYNLWPAIDEEAKKLLIYLGDIRKRCEQDKTKLSKHRKKETMKLLGQITSKLTDALIYLKLRHPPDHQKQDVADAPAALRCEPLLEEDCKMQ